MSAEMMMPVGAPQLEVGGRYETKQWHTRDPSRPRRRACTQVDTTTIECGSTNDLAARVVAGIHRRIRNDRLHAARCVLGTEVHRRSIAQMLRVGHRSLISEPGLWCDSSGRG